MDRELINGVGKLGYTIIGIEEEEGFLTPFLQVERDSERFPNVRDEIEDIEEFFYQVFGMEVGVYNEKGSNILELNYPY